MAEVRPPKFLLETYQDPDAPRSGWERVCQLYRRDESGQYPEEVAFLVKSAITGMMVGMVYSGMPAARFARLQYIKHATAEVYRHRIEAVRSAHNAAIRGFIRYGCRMGWRVAAFTTIFNVVNSSLSAYRDKIAVSHFAAAGAVSGGVFRLSFGLRAVFAASVLGSLMGVPFGMLLCGLQALAGEDLLTSRRQMKHQMYQEKMEEWKERLQLTDVVVEEIQKADAEPAAGEVEKINKLLQQPPNTKPSPAE